MNKLHKLLVKYDSDFCLELKLRSNLINDRIITNETIIIDNLSWPTHIYYNDIPPILNNIKPYINDNVCTYKILYSGGNNAGISLNSPKYIIKNNKTDTFNDSELYSLKDDIRDIVKLLYVNSQRR